MTKRVIDGDAMRASNKLARCVTKVPASTAVYYAWFFTLADCNGSLELTNIRHVWLEASKVLPYLKLDHVQTILREYKREGLLFIWCEKGKRYGHFTGSNLPGRLPPPSWRSRLQQFAPPVPIKQLNSYTSRFTQDDIKGISGGSPDKGLGLGLDWDLDWDKEKLSPNVELRQDHAAAHALPVNVNSEKQNYGGRNASSERNRRPSGAVPAIPGKYAGLG